MKRILTYARNHKGITLVLMAFLLVLLLIFASLAVDISYMYLAKNQLQVAADAAALAGASKLTGEIDDKKSSYEQLPARQEAWKFACKNRATQRPVFLVTNNGGTSETPNCDTLPSSGLNETDNTPTEDIVVGNWQSPTFYPANGKTDRSINAIKVTPRRTGETPGMPRVSLFFGKIFGLLVKGADWSKMSARASAIAELETHLGPLPLCNMNCSVETPLSIINNSEEKNATIGRRYLINPPTNNPHPWPYFTTWTAFLDKSTSVGDVINYIGGQLPPENICKTGCIHTTQGVLEPAMCAMRERMLNESKLHTIKNGTNVYGWKLTVPILPLTSSCPGNCIVDPGTQGNIGGDPFQIVAYAEVIITDVVPEGNCPHLPDTAAIKQDPGPGFVLVGTGLGSNSGYSTIECTDCDDPSAKKLLYTLKLVK